MKIDWKGAWIGAAAGAINGLLGAGGGMLLLPLLDKAAKLEPRSLFPTCVSIMLPITAVTLGIYCLKGQVDWMGAWPYLIGSAIGGVIGSFGAKRIPTVWLHRVMGVFILWGGIHNLL